MENVLKKELLLNEQEKKELFSRYREWIPPQLRPEYSLRVYRLQDPLPYKDGQKWQYYIDGLKVVTRLATYKYNSFKRNIDWILQVDKKDAFSLAHQYIFASDKRRNYALNLKNHIEAARVSNDKKKSLDELKFLARFLYLFAVNVESIFSYTDMSIDLEIPLEALFFVDELNDQSKIPLNVILSKCSNGPILLEDFDGEIEIDNEGLYYEKTVRRFSGIDWDITREPHVLMRKLVIDIIQVLAINSSVVYTEERRLFPAINDPGATILFVPDSRVDFSTVLTRPVNLSSESKASKTGSLLRDVFSVDDSNTYSDNVPAMLMKFFDTLMGFPFDSNGKPVFLEMLQFQRQVKANFETSDALIKKFIEIHGYFDQYLDLVESRDKADIRTRKTAGELLVSATKGKIDPITLGNITELFKSLNCDEQSNFVMMANILTCSFYVINLVKLNGLFITLALISDAVSQKGYFIMADFEWEKIIKFFFCSDDQIGGFCSPVTAHVYLPTEGGRKYDTRKLAVVDIPTRDNMSLLSGNWVV